MVRNEVLKQVDFPETFEANDMVYDIKSTNTEGDFAFWNKNTGEIQNNDWATAGLQYWLNVGNDVETKTPEAGYMSYLSQYAKEMIEETKYYLGTVTNYNANMNGGSESFFGVKDSANEAYKNERAVTGCEGGKGPTENSSRDTLQSNATCRVWPNNQAIWEGKIALLYSSDYGYSADSKYWNTKLGNGTFNGPADSSWLQKTGKHTKFYEWLLSPSSYNASIVAGWNIVGCENDPYVTNAGLAVRPTLYLKSNVKIISGDGSQKNQYKLALD